STCIATFGVLEFGLTAGCSKASILRQFARQRSRENGGCKQKAVPIYRPFAMDMRPARRR
ncbi:MAG TPA: hypothetical protein VGR36_09215, partial [Candidatus Acidoferrales bacterium]|nr:hypothetical protein [Candidatus Acidoferrales bacterium]